jgi:1,4-alpha-glucan branching enzyme
MWALDIEPGGMRWVDADNADDNVFVFLRWAPDGSVVACVFNMSPVVRHDFRVGLPREGRWREVINTDSGHYGGTNVGNAGELVAVGESWHGQPASTRLTLPPLAALYLVPA